MRVRVVTRDSLDCSAVDLDALAVLHGIGVYADRIVHELQYTVDGVAGFRIPGGGIGGQRFRACFAVAGGAASALEIRDAVFAFHAVRKREGAAVAVRMTAQDKVDVVFLQQRRQRPAQQEIVIFVVFAAVQAVVHHDDAPFGFGISADRAVEDSLMIPGDRVVAVQLDEQRVPAQEKVRFVAERMHDAAADPMREVEMQIQIRKIEFVIADDRRDRYAAQRIGRKQKAVFLFGIGDFRLVARRQDERNVRV